MKIIFISGILFSFMVLDIKSQITDSSRIKMNGFYVELFQVNNGLNDRSFTINYERTSGRKKRSGFRVGIYPDFDYDISFLLASTWVTQPAKNHHFETGIGAVFIIEHQIIHYTPISRKWSYDMTVITVPLMYRYQKNDWFFRLGINLYLRRETVPSPSLSIGYRF